MPAEKPIAISPVSESAVCAEQGDLITFEARKTTGRVLRKYLDRRNLTALELLTGYAHLRELRRTDWLFDQAIHRIASIQARNLDEAAPARIDLLYRIAVEAADNARDADDTGGYVKILNEEGLTAALEVIGKAAGPAGRISFIACLRPISVKTGNGAGKSAWLSTCWRSNRTTRAASISTNSAPRSWMGRIRSAIFLARRAIWRPRWAS